MLFKVTSAVKTSDLCPPNNSNSCEWYMKNLSIEAILNQISSIQPATIHPIIESLRYCVETFSNDIKRVEANLSRTKTPEDLQTVVRSFQSIYRFHLLGRIANVVSRVNDDLKNKLETCPSQQEPDIPETIDLTDELEAADQSSNGHHGSETPHTVAASRRKRGGSSLSSTPVVLFSKKRRKVISVYSNKFGDASVISHPLSTSGDHEGTGKDQTYQIPHTASSAPLSAVDALTEGAPETHNEKVLKSLNVPASNSGPCGT